MTGKDAITYRLINSPDDLRQVTVLQHLAWGENPENIISLHMLYSMAINGCPIIGAFHEDLLVGFSNAFYGTDLQNSDRPALANLKLASKRLAVHPDYRSSGIGLQLKLEQKKFADEQGIRLITWTFDPLISRNAYFNIRRLGALARSFQANYYHQITGQVDSIGTSDRLLCEWWITSRRVKERLYGKRRHLTLEQYLSGNALLLNPSLVSRHGLLMPYEGVVDLKLDDRHLLLIEIPADISSFYDDPSLAKSWRDHSRAAFSLTFGAGYIVTDFLHEEYEGRQRSFYVMGFDGVVEESEG